MTFARPVQPGDRVTSSASLSSSLGGRCRSVDVRIADEDGRPVGSFTLGLLVAPGGWRGAPSGRLVDGTGGGSPPDAWPGCSTSEFSLTVDDIAAYAHVAGDDNPIHLDVDAAQALGLPSVIAPGLHVLANVVAGAPRQERAGQLRSVSARFANPVFPNSAVRTSYVWATSDQLRFRSVGDGRVVVKSGSMCFGLPDLDQEDP